MENLDTHRIVSEIYFSPQKPFYHKINPILDFLKIIEAINYPDIIFYWNHFNDRESPNKDLFKYGVRVLNGMIARTDKITVESVFKAIFGYGSFVTKGECVKKSIFQAVKGAIIIEEPDNEKDFIYQKILGEFTDEGLIEYRVTIINRKISIVLKRIRVELFKTSKDEIVTIENPFSEKEIELINIFSVVFGLDFGDLDILRKNGKIYIIDVNNTPSYFILEKAPKSVIETMSNDFYQMINE